MAFSPDGATLASVSSDGPVKLWDVKTRRNVATFSEGGALNFFVSVAFSPDGATLAYGSNRGVELWDVATGENTATLRGNGAVAFSPDGTILASMDSFAGLKLWDVATGANTAILPDHTGAVQSVAFSPDGAMLASGSTDGTARLWDVATKQTIAILGPEDGFWPVAFSPDGATLASGSNSVKLWNVLTKENIATFKHEPFVYPVVFSPDGTVLASGAVDGTIKLWDTSEWVPPRPQRLVKIGDGQRGPAGEQLAAPFVVSVLDQDGSAFAGAVVTFAVTAGGGTLSAATATTDANGRAATTLTLGSEPGPNAVEATVAGLEPVSFTATATGQVPHTLTKVSGDGQEGLAGAQLSEPFVVLLLDEEDEAVAGAVVSFVVTAGGGTISSTISVTDANGHARNTLRLGSEPGTNAVEATVAGLDTVVTFTAIGQESNFAGFDDFFSSKLAALPDSPQLAQNAPNPFNSQTVLAYFLHAPGLTHLEVFALSGQQVAVLQQGPQPAGYHRLRWDGRDAAGRPLASGVYLYRLVTDQGVFTRKLTLLR